MNNKLIVRAKTVLKLQSDTVNYDFTFSKGVSITHVVKNILHLVNDATVHDVIAAAVVERKERISAE
jgi:hypothetical protein